MVRKHSRGQVAQTAVRPRSVVMVAPPVGDAADLLEAVEDLTIQQFVAELGVEALAVTVLPG